MISKLVLHLLKYRYLVVGIVLLMMGISGFYYVKNNGISDNSISVWFEKNDPEYVSYQDTIKKFGHDRSLLVAFEVPDVFSTEALTVIQKTTEALGALPDVERVTSITNTETIEGSGGALNIHPLIEKIPQDEEELFSLKQKALNDRDLVGNLISADSKVAMIVAAVSTSSASEDSRRLIREVHELLLKTNAPGYPVHLGGGPVHDEAFDRTAVQDQRFLFPMTVLVVVFLIYFFFRSFSVALIPTLLQVIVLLATIGLFFFLGNKMNAVMSMVFTVLIAICIADSVHFVLDYYRHYASGLSKEEALAETSSSLWRPCLFTMLTTVDGFIAFQASAIPPIRTIGYYTSFGVLLAFALTIFFLPVVLSFFSPPRREISMRIDSGFIPRLLEKTTNINEKYPRWVLGISALFLLVAMMGMTHIRVEANLANYLPEREKARQDITFFNQKLSGVGTLEVILDSSKEGEFMARDPVVLKQVDDFQQTVLAFPAIRQGLALTNYIKKLNRAFHAEDPKAYRIPDTSQEISQLLLLAESSGDSEIDQYKTLDDRQLHLSFRTDQLSTFTLRKILEKMNREMHGAFDSLGINSSISGWGPLWVRLDYHVIRSQISSFAIAFAIVTLMMMIALKSVKAGLISMIPNVVPILYTMGFMGFFGIELNVATLMIASVSIGITVDDTIHYMIRFREILKEEKDYWKAIRLTNNTAGTAIVFTTCVLVGGLSVLMLGAFSPTVMFGAMVSLTLLVSIICEIFMTPILIVWLKPYR